MNPIELTVTFVDGTSEDVSCIAADLISFEMKFDLSVTRLEKEVRFTHLAYLGYAALNRVGKTKDEFEEWAKNVSGVQEVQTKK